MAAMVWIIAYIVSVVAINVAFSAAPHLDVIWSAWTGLLFVMRDFVQRRIGHWALMPMIIGCVLTYVVTMQIVDAEAAALVAFASTTAFAASEATDWIVYTYTRRPMSERILYSSALSTPIDTIIFGALMDILTWEITMTAIASKLAGVLVVWWMIRRREMAFAT